MLVDSLLQSEMSGTVKKVEYFDTLQKGLLAEVRRGGGVTFYVKHRDLVGRLRQQRIGPYPSISIGAARAQAREFLAGLAPGTRPAEAPPVGAPPMGAPAIGAGEAERPAVPAHPGKLSLSDYVRLHYLPFVRSYKRSHETDARILRRQILPYIGEVPLDALGVEDIVGLQRRLIARKYAPATCNRPIIILRYLYNMAQRWGHVRDNPVRAIRLLRENNQRQTYLKAAEVDRLVAEARRSRSPNVPYIIALLIATGARKSEILNARWSDIDLDMRILTVPLSKSGKVRFIRLNDSAVRIIQSVPRHARSDYLFASPRTGRPLTNFHEVWDRIRVKAGLPHVRLHDLRHTFASQLVNSGCTLYTVQELLGHASPKTTMRYAHLSTAKLVEAANNVVLSGW